MRPVGTAYASLKFNTMVSNRYYAVDGTLRNRGSKLTQRSVDLYAEYGVTREMTVFAGVPVGHLAFESTESVTGVGDINLGMKRGLNLLGYAVAGSITSEFPTGRESAPAKFLDDPKSHINLPTGDGEWNVWLRLDASRFLPGTPFYASLGAGYNVRTEGYSDQYDISLEIGGTVLPSLWVQARARSLFSVAADPDHDRSFVYGEGSEYVQATLGGEWKLMSSFGLVFDWTSAVANQHNIYGGARLSAGIAAHL